MKPSSHRNIRIDVIRATAIGWVLLHHYWNLLRFPAIERLQAGFGSQTYDPFEHFIRLLEGSSLGIKLFWFVSGFCIHTAFLNWWSRRPAPERTGLAAYVPRFFTIRFWRIYPPYLLALLAIFVVEYWGRLDELRSFKHLAIHVACLHNYFEAFFYNINYSFWSIAVESQRYLLYPLLLLLWVRFGPLRAFAICTAISLVVLFVGPQITDAYWMTKNPVFFWFDWLVGAILAERWRTRQTLFRWHGPLLLILGGSFVASFVLPHWQQLRALLQPLTYAVAFEWYIHRSSPLNRFEKIFALLGTISYSVFLLHEPIFRWSLPTLATLFPDLPAWVVLGPGLLVMLVPVIVLSWLYYRWIEVPSNEHGKQRATAGIPVRSQPIPAEAS